LIFFILGEFQLEKIDLTLDLPGPTRIVPEISNLGLDL